MILLYLFISMFKNVSKNMPQLIPFFFVNQVVFTFVILTILVYTFSKFILPKFVRTFISRIYINKL